jgi:hypothetical protein
MLRYVSVVLITTAVVTAALSGREEDRTRAAGANYAYAPQPPAQIQPSTALTPSTTATLHDAPQGKELSRVSSGAALTVLARDRGWVRVRLEGWINEDQLVPADSNMRMSPSAADVRADPAGMQGRLVRWDMEFISWQRADPLRRDMKPDEWYILARGPSGENAISYLVVPANLRSIAESITPLSRIVVNARVRVGRSTPAGVPILDVEAITKR